LMLLAQAIVRGFVSKRLSHMYGQAGLR
jgi:hypothetical protein